MSLHPHESTTAKTTLPLAILVAAALEVVMTLVPLVLPRTWLRETYSLVNGGVYASSSLLFAMGVSDLARRLEGRSVTGARLVQYGFAISVALSMSYALIELAVDPSGNRFELMWTIRSWTYLALNLGIGLGAYLAAGSLARFAPLGIPLVILSAVITLPYSLQRKVWDSLGETYNYIHVALGMAWLALVVLLLRAAARSSVKHVAAEPAAPIAALGAALKGRVIAMLVLVGFTVFALGGRSVGAMKVALVGAAAINVIAFLAFSVAALRASRGLDTGLQLAFAASGALSMWCGGVLAKQTPAIYQVLTERSSYLGERYADIARALSLATPLIATLGVVVALVATGAYMRRQGHLEIAETIGPRTTTYVILMLASVIVQVYLAPKARSAGELGMLGLLTAAAGVSALLVAARLFQRASEAAGTTALPTATVLPPS